MKIWQFMLLVGFVWAYTLIAKKFDTPFFRESTNLKDRTLSWIWVSIGIGFIIFNIIALFFSKFWEYGLFKTLFIWFCTNGIFAILVLRIVLGLIKCILGQSKTKKL